MPAFLFAGRIKKYFQGKMLASILGARAEQLRCSDQIFLLFLSSKYHDM
jgi:hypothetical protein